jgi:hypothetical protein
VTTRHWDSSIAYLAFPAPRQYDNMSCICGIATLEQHPIRSSLDWVHCDRKGTELTETPRHVQDGLFTSWEQRWTQCQDGRSCINSQFSYCFQLHSAAFCMCVCGGGVPFVLHQSDTNRLVTPSEETGSACNECRTFVRRTKEMKSPPLQPEPQTSHYWDMLSGNGSTGNWTPSMQSRRLSLRLRWDYPFLSQCAHTQSSLWFRDSFTSLLPRKEKNS